MNLLAPGFDRVPETTRRAWFAGVVVILALAVAGTNDANIAQAKYDDERASQREYVAAKKAKRAQEQPAPIWSQRCERLGKRILATQSDGGKWKAQCVDGKGVRT